MTKYSTLYALKSPKDKCTHKLISCSQLRTLKLPVAYGWLGPIHQSILPLRYDWSKTKIESLHFSVFPHTIHILNLPNKQTLLNFTVICYKHNHRFYISHVLLTDKMYKIFLKGPTNTLKCNLMVLLKIFCTYNLNVHVTGGSCKLYEPLDYNLRFTLWWQWRFLYLVHMYQHFKMMINMAIFSKMFVHIYQTMWYYSSTEEIKVFWDTTLYWLLNSYYVSNELNM
jgi:hypothetical protein